MSAGEDFRRFVRCLSVVSGPFVLIWFSRSALAGVGRVLLAGVVALWRCGVCAAVAKRLGSYFVLRHRVRLVVFIAAAVIVVAFLQSLAAVRPCWLGHGPFPSAMQRQ